MELSRKSLFSRIIFTLVLCLLSGLITDAMAVNFTWTGTTSTDWNTQSNWNPSYGYPVAPGDTATFPKNAKNYNVSIPSPPFLTKSPIVLSNLTFNGIYTLTNDGDMTVSSTNNSGITGLAASTSSIINNSYLKFEKTANVGTVNITNNDDWCHLDFYDTASAGSAKIINNDFSYLNFYGNASAGSANITNKGTLNFKDYSKADNAKIDNTSGTLDVSYMKIGLTIGSLYETQDTEPGHIRLN